MEEEFNINYKYVIFALLIISTLLIGIYVGGISPKKELKQIKAVLSTCQNYCVALNETGYVRYEPKDTHYKCFCYSDNTRKMEE